MLQNLFPGTLAVLALGLAAALLAPRPSDGFVLLGHSLDLSQRDLRVHDNFLDEEANNNVTPDAAFPGYDGAELAIWKAAVEWGSELHGDGSGDPHQTNGLGSGGANFDPSWQGRAPGVGTPGSNVFSALDANGGALIAVTEIEPTGGWRVRFYESEDFADGPGVGIADGNRDLQGVATHEYGHALGLDDSVSGNTMQAVLPGAGVAQRSIEPDDVAGLQAIYGTKSASKPRITGVAVVASAVTITGTGFADTDNEVWFTKAGLAGNGDPVKLTGVAATAGGTQIDVTAPFGAGPGDVLVKSGGGSGGDSLSNAWPIDVTGEPPAGGVPVVDAVTPSSVEAIVVDGPAEITLTGQGFLDVFAVTVGGIALETFPAEFHVVSDTKMTFDMPLQAALGPALVELENSQGVGTTTVDVVANASPTLELASSDPLFLISTVDIEISMATTPGDIAFLALSTELGPTIVPGLFSFDIGNNFTSLFNLGAHVVPGSGYAQVSIPFAGLQTGTKLYFQAGVFELAVGQLPVTSTNYQVGTVLF